MSALAERFKALCEHFRPNDYLCTDAELRVFLATLKVPKKAEEIRQYIKTERMKVISLCGEEMYSLNYAMTDERVWKAAGQEDGTGSRESAGYPLKAIPASRSDGYVIRRISAISTRRIPCKRYTQFGRRFGSCLGMDRADVLAFIGARVNFSLRQMGWIVDLVDSIEFKRKQGRLAGQAMRAKANGYRRADGKKMSADRIQRCEKVLRFMSDTMEGKCSITD